MYICENIKIAYASIQEEVRVEALGRSTVK